jgi:hypothetical protein
MPTRIRLSNQPAFGGGLVRKINTSHQEFMNGPSYRPNKRPRGVADDKNKTTG